jgi:serine/threonine-protein kinase ATR
VANIHSGKDLKQKRGNLVGRFVNAQALGLMARLTDVINDVAVLSHPSQDKRRYIRAMEQMIIASKEYVRVARPQVRPRDSSCYCKRLTYAQICACLLAALPHDDLREASFATWCAMLVYMGEEDIEALLDTTFFILDHYWLRFNEWTQQLSEDVLAYLIGKHEPVLRKVVDRLPRLGHIGRLAQVDERLSSLRRTLDNKEAFNLFAQRLSHEHSGVVLQALKELSAYLKTNQDYLQTSALSDQPDTVLATLVRALLDCASTYSGIQLDIACLCTECLGLVGCIDSNRVESVREQRSFVVLHNFALAEETTDFVLFILEEVLVKSFLSATDTKLQGFLSWAMQELLERCNIPAACQLETVSTGGGDATYRKWLGLSDVTREVLSPFLTSQYLLSPMNANPVEYPIFRPGRSYGNWLKFIVLDLLRRGQTVLADVIFEPLCRVIRVKDLSIAERLLPYLFVHIIVSDKSPTDVREKVVGELVSILQYQPSDAMSYTEKEDLKLFCGVSKPPR